MLYNWSFGRKSAGEVEAGNRVADEPADRFGGGLLLAARP
jgi:hypothetical protein